MKAHGLLIFPKTDFSASTVLVCLGLVSHLLDDAFKKQCFVAPGLTFHTGEKQEGNTISMENAAG